MENLNAFWKIAKTTLKILLALFILGAFITEFNSGLQEVGKLLGIVFFPIIILAIISLIK